MNKQNQELAQLWDWLLPMLVNGQVTVGDVEGRWVWWRRSERAMNNFAKVVNRTQLWLSSVTGKNL